MIWVDFNDFADELQSLCLEFDMVIYKNISI